jgi:hypothetical protein
VQRFDRQAYAAFLRVRAQLGKRFRDAFAGAVEIAAAGRETAGDQDQGVGGQGRRLVDRGAVVAQGAGPFGRVERGEEAAPAKAGDGQTRGATGRGSTR